MHSTTIIRESINLPNAHLHIYTDNSQYDQIAESSPIRKRIKGVMSPAHQNVTLRTSKSSLLHSAATEVTNVVAAFKFAARTLYDTATVAATDNLQHI